MGYSILYQEYNLTGFDHPKRRHSREVPAVQAPPPLTALADAASVAAAELQAWPTTLKLRVLGFRVRNLGFGVLGCGFGVLKVWVWGLGCWGLRFRVLGF